MTSREIRQSFLDYFARHDHRVVSSSSLLPGDDPTLLFTNAGMNQFKDLFLGRDSRDYQRAATSQKCMRVSGKHNDLDNVGPSLRHHTFFEMLGNFSFGDYFKAEAIPFAWELLTDVWGLAPDQLFPTVFKGEAGIPRDDEAIALWKQFVPPNRIAELGLSENFWQMGETGPCGRCSEIHYFRGDTVPCPAPVCRGIECDCERYVEVWNNVFMEFVRDEQGQLSPLPAPSIDTGMGLERISAVIQNKTSNYDTDLFTPILKAIAERAGQPYSGATTPDHPDVSMRVVADHLRAMTFLISDGVLPSNEWRGYVLRKIMRRAMRHGKRLGFTKPTLHELTGVVVREMADHYTDLARHADLVASTVHAEEERFDAVLTSGLPKLEELLDRTVAGGGSVVPGAEVFRLYDSLGVPLDFAEDLAGQRGLTIDHAAYEESMGGQRERARGASAFDTRKGAGFSYPDDARRDAIERAPDQFVGYEATAAEASVVALFDGKRRAVDRVDPGEQQFVVLDRTPFYLQSGGQISDAGVLRAGDAIVARVTGVSRVAPGGPRAHLVAVDRPIAVGDRLEACVDDAVRDATRRNHTATHLLHAALRRQLGEHVRQAGSLVAPDRLRFDFSHFAGVTQEERQSIERVVNEEIYRNQPVKTEERSTEEAISAGAMALFGEKYGDRVRVVSIADFSLELCGGTHVTATGDIGPFVITEESGVAAGVRRIEALTGAGAVAYLQAQGAALDRAVAALGVPADRAHEAVARLQAEAKRLARDNEQLKMKLALAGGAGTDTGDDVVTIGDARFVARRVVGLEKGALRGLADSLRDRLKRGVVVIAAENDGRVQLLVSVTKDLTDRIKAGQMVKELAPMVGGGGGGRPDFAEAGGKDASRIDELLQAALKMVEAALA